MLRMRFFILL